MIIMKFGGSTLASANHVKQVAKIIKHYLSRQPIIIISALSGVTDILEDLASQASRSGRFPLDVLRKRHNQIIERLGITISQIDRDYEHLWSELELILKGISLLKELTPRTLDYVLSFGERFAARLLAAYFNKEEIEVQTFDAHQIGLFTDSNFGNAHPLPEAAIRLTNVLRRIKRVPLITGFIGRDKAGNITTLGRNGSDYTASFIGAALGAREIQLWRAIDGVMTADPEIIKNAHPVKEITLAEASELARYGGDIFHPYMLVPATERKIPIRIMNIFNPSAGTTVVNHSRLKGIVKSIAYKPDISLINLISPEMFHHRGLVTRVFDILGAHKIEVDMLASSRVSLSLAVLDRASSDLQSALNEIKQFTEVNITPHKAVVCIIGEGIKKIPDLLSRIFLALQQAHIKIEMISHGATHTNLTILVNNLQAPEAVRVLHKTLFR